MVLDTVARRIRRSGDNPTLKRDSWWPTSFLPWASNGKVNDAAALSITPFYRGLVLISGTIASMPLQVFKQDVDKSGAEGERTKLKEKDTAYLWDRPNAEMVNIDMWGRVVADMVRGNGYIWVDKDGDGGISGIWWLARNRVRPGRTTSGQKVYEVDGELPMIDYKQGGEIVHLPNWGDGIAGYDPVQIAAKALSLGLSAEQFATEFFTGGGVPSGILATEQFLTQAQADAVLASWVARIRSNRPAVLGGGVKYQQTATDAEKSQLQELRSFQVQEVARLLGIPPALLADVDHSSQGGGNGVEEMNRQFYVYTLQPLITRIEQAVSSDLLVRELTGRYIKLNADNFLRGNTLTRNQAYRLMDYMTINEKRALEDMEPIEGGDVLLQPLNLAPLEDIGIDNNPRPSRPTGR